MGKNFYSEKEFVNQNQVVTKTINVSDLKTGFYFVRLTTNEKQKVYKIFKF